MTSLQVEMRAGSRGGRGRERGRWSLPKWLFRGSVAEQGRRSWCRQTWRSRESCRQPRGLSLRGGVGQGGGEQGVGRGAGQAAGDRWRLGPPARS